MNDILFNTVIISLLHRIDGYERLIVVCVYVNKCRRTATD